MVWGDVVHLTSRLARRLFSEVADAAVGADQRDVQYKHFIAFFLGVA